MSKQNGPEIHPAVKAENVQAKRNAEAFSEATRKAVADATVFAEVVKHRKRSRATLGLFIRLAVAAILTALVITCRTSGHLSPEVTIVAVMTFSTWVTILIGAWAQFMWEGIFK